MITFLLGLILGRHWTKPFPAPFTYITFMALTATLGILAVYILVALSGMVTFWRTRGENVAYNVLLDIVLPVGAVAICGYTIYKSVHPLPPSPMQYGPWIALAWFGLGLIITGWLSVTSPEHVREFGSILGEGEVVPSSRDLDARPLANPHG